MSLAKRLRTIRESQDLSLDEVASRARISKTYLWELEKDTASEKKPSADVLLRIATALSVTIADLLELPTVKVQEPLEISASLRDFCERMERLDDSLTPQDLRDLASMKFRGGQPKTADEWHQLYLALVGTRRKRKQ